MDIAVDFVWPPGQPQIVVNYFGLMLFDLKGGAEILLPNTKTVSAHVHEPRLWARTQGTGTAPSGTYAGEHDIYYWSIADTNVSFALLNAEGNPVDPSARASVTAASKHPWHKPEVVADLCSIKKASLIGTADRSKPELVTTIVQMNDGVLEPATPWSAAGLVGEWEYPPHKPLIAMTDNCNWIRMPQSDATTIRVSLASRIGGAPRTVNFPTTGCVPFVVSHIYPGKIGHAVGVLEDNRAYALLLGLDPTAYAPPVFRRGTHGHKEPPVGGVWISSEDGHCNCAWCP